MGWAYEYAFKDGWFGTLISGWDVGHSERRQKGGLVKVDRNRCRKKDYSIL